MGNPKPFPVYWDKILINASQVTNPSIDPLREPMETRVFLGKKPDAIKRDKSGKIIKDPCQNCRGTGYVKVNKKLSVNIPAGIDDGERIALRAQGCDGRNGGPAGDLIITVNVKRHNIFERDGYNLFCEVPLTVAEATLGAEIDVPTLDGNVKYTIPEGTQPGTSFTLRQKGMPYINNANRKGDLIFTVNVEIPKGLNDKQKAHMRAFAEACGDNNYSKKSGFFKRIFDKNK